MIKTLKVRLYPDEQQKILLERHFGPCRFEPSSKLCSSCGNIKHNLKLSDRIYHCNACDLSTGRDLNASINILRMGLVKVGQGMPEYTPVESVTAAELSKGGLRVATL